MGEIMEKTALPIKTKIAAWWMVIVGLIFSMVSFWVNAKCYDFHFLYDETKFLFFSYYVFILSAPSFISLILLFLPGVLLLSKRRWALQFAVIVLSLGGLLEIIDILLVFSEDLIYYAFPRFLSGVLLLPLLLIPFLLLVLDKKKFSQTASSK